MQTKRDQADAMHHEADRKSDNRSARSSHHGSHPSSHHSPRYRPTPFVVFSLALHAIVLLWLIVVPAHWPFLLTAFVIDHILLATIGLWPRSHYLGSNLTRLPQSASQTAKCVAITIDDGPDPEVTPKVLEILKAHGAHASFFCIGKHAEQHPELCRQIVDAGHSLENHTQSHHYGFALFGIARQRAEILAAQETIQRISGRKPVFFRAPAGIRNPLLDPVLQNLGLQLTSWTRRGFDTCRNDPDKILAALTRNLQSGDILLLHDGHAARDAKGIPVILRVLPALLERCKQDGLRPVSLAAAVAPASEDAVLPVAA